LALALCASVEADVVVAVVGVAVAGGDEAAVVVLGL
jgi:hypothetical protein